MACLAMHLAIASKYLEKNNIEDNVDIIRGAYLPDVDGDKILSHYGTKTTYPTTKEFLYKKVDIVKCVLDLDFDSDLDRGKFLHLFTDYIFYRFIYCEKLERSTDSSADWLLYKDFDYTTNYILEHYDIPVPDTVSHIVCKKDNATSYIVASDIMIDAVIDVMSSIDIDECRERILHGLDDLVCGMLEKLQSYVKGE